MNEQSNNAFYKLDTNATHALRRKVLKFVKENIKITRKRIYKDFNTVSEKIGPRITELLQAGYLGEDGTQEGSGLLVALKDVYNPEDFTSDKIRKNREIYKNKVRLAKNEPLNKNFMTMDELISMQIGKVVKLLAMDKFSDNAEKIRFFDFYAKAETDLRETRNVEQYMENIKLIKKYWGGYA